MSHGIVGTRQTVHETSFYNHNEKQWYHVARYFRYDLHATKGWRRNGTHKMVTKIHSKYRVQGIRVTDKFDWKEKPTGRRLQVRP